MQYIHYIAYCAQLQFKLDNYSYAISIIKQGQFPGASGSGSKRTGSLSELVGVSGLTFMLFPGTVDTYVGI